MHIKVGHSSLFNTHMHTQYAEPGYRRLAPSQPVGLKHTGYVITLEKVEKVSDIGYLVTHLPVIAVYHRCSEFRNSTKEEPFTPDSARMRPQFCCTTNHDSACMCPIKWAWPLLAM